LILLHATIGKFIGSLDSFFGEEVGDFLGPQSVEVLQPF
jgi:hypothetical protein